MSEGERRNPDALSLRPKLFLVVPYYNYSILGPKTLFLQPQPTLNRWKGFAPAIRVWQPPRDSAP